jgi:hypothetical protein
MVEVFSCRNVISRVSRVLELIEVVRAVSSSVEWSQRILGGWCEMPASLGPTWLSCQLTRVLHGWLWQEDLSVGTVIDWLHVRVCVCVGGVVNKSIHQSIPRHKPHTPKSWHSGVGSLRLETALDLHHYTATLWIWASNGAPTGI